MSGSLFRSSKSSVSFPLFASIKGFFHHQTIIYLLLLHSTQSPQVAGYDRFRLFEANMTSGSSVISGQVRALEMVIYRYDYVMAPFLRIRSEANATWDYPLFVSVKELKSQTPWKLPSNKINYGGQLARFSKTICAFEQNLVVELSTFSPTPIHFRFEFSEVDRYSVPLGYVRTEIILPQEPRYAHFKFPPGMKRVWLKAFSADDSCILVTIRTFTCSANNSDTDLRTMFFTMTSRASVAIHAKHFSEFDLVFELADFRDPCWEKQGMQINTSVVVIEDLAANLTFHLEPHLKNRYFALGWFAVITFGLAILVTITCTVPQIRNVLQYPSKKPVSKVLHKPQKPQFASGSFLFNLLIIAAFYTLPAMQLLFNFFVHTRKEPSQDICYFNNFCSNSWGPFVAFNSLYSNISYIIFGVFFIIIVRFHSNRFPWRYVEVFYSMGVALILEGFLSAGYHICPTENNFQFDTTFMFVIAGLCIYHLYQIRNLANPGHTYKFYGIFAIAVIFTVGGIVNQEDSKWAIALAVIYVLVALLIGFLAMRLLYWKNEAARQHPTCRKYMGGVQVLTNLLFIGYSAWSLMKVPDSFPSILLNMFICNLGLFTIFYFTVKILDKELIVAAPLLCSVMSVISWAVSLYFYNVPVSNWQLSAAMSRAMNKECIFLEFFDYHDIWHFGSSFSLFLSFLLLLTLDDGQDIKEDVGVVVDALNSAGEQIHAASSPLIEVIDGRAGPGGVSLLNMRSTSTDDFLDCYGSLEPSRTASPEAEKFVECRSSSRSSNCAKL